MVIQNFLQLKNTTVLYTFDFWIRINLYQYHVYMQTRVAKNI